MDKKRMAYIDGIKMIAALGVAYSHFYGFFRTDIDPYMLPKYIDNIYWNNWLISGFFNGTAWVSVFFTL